MSIDPNNVYIHNRYDGDFKSGYDIALIAIKDEDYIKIEHYI